MGMRRISTSTYSEKQELPNPDPTKYKILEWYIVNNALILSVQYTGCINYEGKKILVYENAKAAAEWIMQHHNIDPHFCDTLEACSPVARFEPTHRGMVWACVFAKNL